MEVILPHNFDRSLLVFNRPQSNTPNFQGISYLIDPNGQESSYGWYDLPVRHYYLNDGYNNAERRGDDTGLRYYVNPPNNAIWSTIHTTYNNFTADSYDKSVFVTGVNQPIIPFNFVRPLATIATKKEPLNGMPKSEYCVIQNEDDYKAFSLDELGEYKIQNNIVTIDSAKEFLESRLERYNGEQVYKIIRRQVLLTKLVGKSSIKNKLFQELLLVDCEILNQEVTRIAKGLNIKLHRCSFTERPILLEMLHFKLFHNHDVRLPDIALQVERLSELTKTMHNIYVVSDEISRLRSILNVDSAEKDSVNKQLVESSETISQLRCAKRTAESRISELEIEVSAGITRVKSLEEQLATSEQTGKSLNEIVKDLKDQVFKLNKRINILEINAAKDEALIQTLRAEKAFWNTSTTKSFEDEQKRAKEIQELKDKLNALF
jgi:uncharacterized coiled-coil protein SlyX